MKEPTDYEDYEIMSPALNAAVCDAHMPGCDGCSCRRGAPRSTKGVAMCAPACRGDVSAFFCCVEGDGRLGLCVSAFRAAESEVLWLGFRQREDADTGAGHFIRAEGAIEGLPETIAVIKKQHEEA